MKLIALKDFVYVHNGYDRREYTKGQEIDTDDEEMINVSKKEKWVKPLGESVVPEASEQADSDELSDSDADHSSNEDGFSDVRPEVMGAE